MNLGNAVTLRTFFPGFPGFPGLLGLPVAILLGAAPAATAAQPDAQIALDPAIECWSDSEFPMLGALVTPPEGIVRSRLYFRCSLYPDYYFVDLTVESGTYRGVAPQAEEACPQVQYYVEALGGDFTSTRTEERVADVASPDECRRRYPGSAFFTGGDPGIFLGSLGNVAMAPGFKTLGIAGFITSVGTVAATGTGISTGVVAGVAAGGAVAAGLGVLATGGSSTTTTSPTFVPPATSTTTAPAPTTTAGPGPGPGPGPPGINACIETDPANGRIEVNRSLRIDGRCSTGSNLEFRWDLGDGRTRTGPFITVTWDTPGTYTLRLTVTNGTVGARAGEPLAEDSESKEIHVVPRPEPPEPPPPPPSPVVADFVAQSELGTCLGIFDGSPSTGSIARYLWELDVEEQFGPKVLVEGQIVSNDWLHACADDQGDDGSVTAKLTVVGTGGNQSSITKDVTIFFFFLSAEGRAAHVESSFASEMLQATGVEGRLVIEGGRAFSVSAEAPTRIQFGARRGQVSVEAVATTAKSPFLWRFDFAGAKGFVPGSLRIISGQEVVRDAFSVVLRFSGDAFERARFEYRMEP
jgi:hypothetical protein